MDDSYGKMAALELKLKELGWISGAVYQRCHAWYEWTDAGRSVFPAFISEMRKRGTVFTADEIEFVNANVFLLGIKSKCKRELLLESLRETFDRWGNEALIAMTNASQKEFSRPAIFELLDWIHENNAGEIRVFRKARMADQGDWVMKIPRGTYK